MLWAYLLELQCCLWRVPCLSHFIQPSSLLCSAQGCWAGGNTRPWQGHADTRESWTFWVGPVFKDPALCRRTRLLSDQKGCRVGSLRGVGGFPMRKTFYLVLDWQTWWISWEYTSGHPKSVCVWSVNKLLEKLCCGSAR